MSKSQQIARLSKQVQDLQKILQPNKIILTSVENPEISVEISLIGTELKFIKKTTSVQEFELSNLSLND